MFWMRNKENKFPIHTLIWRPDAALQDIVKSLLEAHALIEAHSPVWTPKVQVFKQISQKIERLIKDHQ